MGFFKQIKKAISGEENTVQTPQQTKINSSSKTLAEYARKGAEDLASDLSGLQFTNFNQRIPDEKMNTYRATVKLLRDKLANAPVMALDTRTIDEKLREMIPLFQQAISSGYEETASDICKLIFTGITEIRTDIYKTDPLEKEWELEKRGNKLDKQLTRLRYCLTVDELRDNVARADEAIGNGQKEFFAAKRELQAKMTEFPELAERLEEIAIISPEDAGNGELLSLDAQRKRMVNAYNTVERSKAIKAFKEQRIEKIVANIKVLEAQIMHEADRLNPKLIEQQQQFAKEYNQMLLDERKENEQLEGIVKSFDAGIRQYLTDSETINSVIATNLAAQKIARQEQERETARKIAIEQQKKQKAEQTVSNQMHTN